MKTLKTIALFVLFFTFFERSNAENIDTYLIQKGEKPTICSDELFLRRAYLVLTGRLPKRENVVSFLSDTDNNKRRKLVEELIASDAYVTYYGNLWGDMLRIKSEFPSNLWPNGVQAYNRWVHEKLAANVPYNLMVKELLLSKGSNFRDPAVNFYRAFPRKTASNVYQNIELLFLGVRKPTYDGSRFFEQIRYKSTKEWKEEIVYIDYTLAPTLSSVQIEGQALPLVANEDWRKVYVDWLTAPTNKRFAAVMANRLWFWMNGQGIVDEPDNWSDSNPPANPQLLDYLTRKFISSGYDMKALVKEIALSSAFQSTTVTRTSFKPTRISSELLVDAIADITGLSDSYSSRVPEPFTFYPVGTRAIELGDATVSSSTLELFGRASRDVSLENQHVKEINSRQLLYLMNSSELEVKLRKSPLLNDLCKSPLSVGELSKLITLTVLSRYPTPSELELYKAYASAQRSSTKQLCYDLVWMQMNSSEFLFNH